MIATSDDLIERIRMEFLEMPGLALTPPQARRLWNVDADVCDHVIRALVREGFLAESAGGAFLRRTAGPHA